MIHEKSKINIQTKDYFELSDVPICVETNLSLKNHWIKS